MPKKDTPTEEEVEKETLKVEQKEDEVTKLNRLLATVLNYLSDDEVEEIDIESLLDNTEGLRDWWNQYQENNRKEIEEEIMTSIGNLPIEELKSIRERIKEFEG